jgi:hypothetical protein
MDRSVDTTSPTTSTQAEPRARWTATIRPRPTEVASRGERATLVGSGAGFLAVASGAALSTMNDVVRWPAVITFVVAIALAIWARSVLGPQKH